MDYAKKPWMVMSTWKSERICMASHKPASLPTSSSNPSCTPWAMGTSNIPSRLSSGNTLHDPSGSTCVWTTLASNTLVMNTSSTFLLPFEQRRTTSSKIGRAIFIVVSLSHGTTANDMLTWQCLPRLPNSYSSTSIHILKSCNIAHTTRIQSSMAKTIKLLTQSTQVPNLTKPTKNTSNKLLKASYIMHALLIPPSLWHYLLSLANKLLLLKIHATT